MAGLGAWLGKFLAAIVLCASPSLVLAQNIADGGEIRIGSTTDPALIRDSIGGYDIVQYRFVAMAGDRLKIEFTSSHPGGAFNLLSPGDGRMLYESDGAGRLFETILADTGEYRLRVYLSQEAARSGEHSAYALALALDQGANPAPSDASGDDLVIYAPDVAPGSGLGAGPAIDDDYAWHVRGLGGATLPIRSGAGPQFRAIGQLVEGAAVENLGCQDANAGYWCRIATLTRPRVSGWINGRFLTDEGSGRPYGDDHRYQRSGLPYDAEGPLNCQYGGSARMVSCRYGVIRNGPLAQVDIILPDGSNRSLSYRAGRFSGAEQDMNVTSRRQNGEAVVIVDGQETYYIPDDVVMGD